MPQIIVSEESELLGVAETFLKMSLRAQGASIIALSGNLGAGKTALAKACARALGVTEHVTSPTFVIMKTYQIPDHPPFREFTHIDAYRIDDEKELAVLGFETLLADPERLIIIEWPERVLRLIPEDALMIDMKIGENEERIITYGKK